MGLTLHYKLRAPARATDAKIRTLVDAMRTHALAFQRAGRVQSVSPVRKSADNSEFRR